MNDRERLIQLRVLRDRLERQEASPERDWMLTEVRRRAVDVESDGRSAPLRPLVLGPEIEPAPAPPRAPAPATVKRTASRPRPQPPQAAPAPMLAVAVAVAAAVATPVPEGLLLCLDDEAAVSPQPQPQGAMVPWARGLRG